MSLLLERHDTYQQSIGCIRAEDVPHHLEPRTQELQQTLENFDTIVETGESKRFLLGRSYYEVSHEYSGLDVVRSLIIPVKTRQGRPDFSAGHDISYVESTSGDIVSHKQVFEGRVGTEAKAELPYQPLDQIDRKHFGLVMAILSRQ